MKPTACLAIVVAISISPILARPASAQVAIGAPATSPRALVRPAPSRSTPPASEIGALMTIARAQPAPALSAESASGVPARSEAAYQLEPDRAPRRHGF